MNKERTKKDYNRIQNLFNLNKRYNTRVRDQKIKTLSIPMLKNIIQVRQIKELQKSYQPVKKHT